MNEKKIQRLNYIFLITIFVLINNLYFSADILCSAEKLDLSKCVEMAIRQNPRMKIAEQSIISAKAKKREAFASYLPNISGSASYIKRKEVESNAALSGMASASPSLKFSFADEILDTKLTLTQPVFMWGKIHHANKQASLNYKYVEEEYRKTKQQIIYETKSAFYQCLLSQHMLDVAKEAFNVTDAHLNVVKKFYDEGRSSSYDVSRAKVSLANAKTNLLQAENGFYLAKEALLNILDAKDRDMEFTGKLEYAPAEFQISNMFAEALANRPEIKQMELQEGISKSLIKIVSSENKPSIAVTAYTEWQNTEWQTKGWYNSWTAAAVLNVPIFDGFSTCQKKKQAKIGLEQVEISRAALESGIKLEINSLYLNFDRSKKSIDANRENVDTARDNLKIAEKRFQLGLMTDIEVRDAQLSLTQAEMNYYQAVYDYNLSIAGLEKAIGK